MYGVPLRRVQGLGIRVSGPLRTGPDGCKGLLKDSTKVALRNCRASVGLSVGWLVKILCFPRPKP